MLTGAPPVAGTRDMPPPPNAEKRITPSWFHEPPVPTPTSQSVAGRPPLTSTFFNLPPAKKPMKRLSGDQKGWVAPSAPSNGLASEDASARTQSCTLVPVAAVKASQFPSGETAV